MNLKQWHLLSSATAGAILSAIIIGSGASSCSPRSSLPANAGDKGDQGKSDIGSYGDRGFSFQDVPKNYPQKASPDSASNPPESIGENRDTSPDMRSAGQAGQPGQVPQSPESSEAKGTGNGLRTDMGAGPEQPDFKYGEAPGQIGNAPGVSTGTVGGPRNSYGTGGRQIPFGNPKP